MTISYRGKLLFEHIDVTYLGCLYEIFGKEIYSLSCKPQTIVDLGAYKGESALYFTRRYPDAHVYALEPFRDNVAALKSHLALNPEDSKKITVIEAAAGNIDGKKDFFLTENAELCSTININNVNTSEKVQIYTMQTIMEKYALDQIDLMKIDIEGGEYELLMQMPGTVLSRIQAIVMEVHPTQDHSFKDLIEHLQSQGFSVVDFDKAGLIYQLKRIT